MAPDKRTGNVKKPYRFRPSPEARRGIRCFEVSVNMWVRKFRPIRHSSLLVRLLVLIAWFEDGGVCMICGPDVSLKPKDYELARKIRGEYAY